MREKRNYFSRASKRIRITPAYAGKTTVFMGYLHKRQDHPRVCGKNILGCESAKTHEGSPPRMREKQG